jgi:hypothetical protein
MSKKIVLLIAAVAHEDLVSVGISLCLCIKRRPASRRRSVTGVITLNPSH